jgi:hypothetical protein
LELRGGVDGDVLDLVVAEEFGVEHVALVQRERGGLARLVVDPRRLVLPGALDPVAGPLAGLDLDRDRGAFEVGLEQPLDPVVASLLAPRMRHAVERPAQDLEHGALARPARPDQAVEVLVKLELHAPQEPALDRQLEDPVIGRRAHVSS